MIGLAKLFLWIKRRFGGEGEDLSTVTSTTSTAALPFEFIVVGTPVSLQTRNKKRLNDWKVRVAEAAQLAWSAGYGPVSHEVSVQIKYFFEAEAPDVDNIIKPIQDAMVGIVYLDDSQVADTSCRKSNIAGTFRILGVSEQLAVQLTRGTDFIQVRVATGPSHEELR